MLKVSTTPFLMSGQRGHGLVERARRIGGLHDPVEEGFGRIPDERTPLVRT
jgi:hypothetical protein